MKIEDVSRLDIYTNFYHSIEYLYVPALPSTSDYISSLESINGSPKPKHQSAFTKVMDKVTFKKENNKK
jgi:hypothetical protein